MILYGVDNKRIMRKYSKGYLAFTQGKFDEWAVYVKYPNFPEWPTDKWYFKMRNT